MKLVSSSAALLALALGAVAPSMVSAEEPLREGHPGDDFVVREAMVPMRDGVKLFTVILAPKNTTDGLPILLERTPYDASRAVGGRATKRLAVLRGTKWLGGGLIHVDPGHPRPIPVGGRLRHVPGAPRRVQPSETDETTDAWDTIDWLVKNVPRQRPSGSVGHFLPGVAHPRGDA